MTKNIYDTICITTMKLPLRRTLVRSVIQLNKWQVSLLIVIFCFIASEVKAQQATWMGSRRFRNGAFNFKLNDN